MEELLCILGFEGELSGELCLYTCVDIVFEVILILGGALMKTAHNEVKAQRVGQLVVQVTSWIRTSFVNRYITKLDKVVEKAILHANTTEEISLILNSLRTEMAQCYDILVYSQKVSEECISKAKEVEYEYHESSI